jgi:hypothetical protein
LLVDLIVLVFGVADRDRQQHLRIQELQETWGQRIGGIVDIGGRQRAVRANQTGKRRCLIPLGCFLWRWLRCDHRNKLLNCCLYESNADVVFYHLERAAVRKNVHVAVMYSQQ